MNKYSVLVRILDQIRKEAGSTDKYSRLYAIESANQDEISQARSRAYIHLYLKVMFGLTEFSDREHFITDGSYDGGIDGYYIDTELKRIYVIQSKFRQSEEGFEEKKVDTDALLKMDIDRIISGLECDDDGNKYNGKIYQFQREISQLKDIARYTYVVIILANCSLSPEKLARLTGGYKATVFNYNQAYDDLVFPVVSGTYFRASELILQLDLNNKSAGARTNYSVSTPAYNCEITVLFVPTLEIAKIMDKFRNSILEYNPRSYLDLEGQKVNASIRETLLRPESNEFALMNNGLTIISDETNINERMGLHNKAQLRIVNPQIINGGQTAYTLSRLYSTNKALAPDRFAGKEVLVKVITLSAKDDVENNSSERKRLIDEISAATNRQTVVIGTDQYANASIHIELQKILFDRYGLLYERKRGEFSDGVKSGYINRDEILDRSVFIRLMLVVLGKIRKSTKKKIFAEHDLTDEELKNPAALDKFIIAYKMFKIFAPKDTSSPKTYRSVLAKVFLGTTLNLDNDLSDLELAASVELEWQELIRFVSKTKQKKFTTKHIDKKTGEVREFFSIQRWMNSNDVEDDVVIFANREKALAND